MGETSVSPSWFRLPLRFRSEARSTVTPFLKEFDLLFCRCARPSSSINRPEFQLYTTRYTLPTILCGYTTLLELILSKIPEKKKVCRPALREGRDGLTHPAAQLSFRKENRFPPPVRLWRAKRKGSLGERIFINHLSYNISRIKEVRVQRGRGAQRSGAEKSARARRLYFSIIQIISCL
jgi:hypothetical protein